MTFDIKRRLKLLFRPDAHAARQHQEAWAVLTKAARKTQLELHAEVEENGLEAVIRRLIDSGDPIEFVALLDALGGSADNYQITSEVIADIDGSGEFIEAWEQRARQFLASLLNGEPALHHANGNAALPT